MSRLEELMQELCPDGGEFGELEDVLTIKNGRDYKKFSTGDIPVYGSGGVITYINTAAYDKPSVLIPRKGSLDKLYYVDSPFWNVDTIFYTEINTAKVLPKYVYYWLTAQHLERLNKAGGVPSLTQAVLNQVKIPVPPLPVQGEIVRILDNFTERTTELAEQLTAELTARKKQYEYYLERIIVSCNNAQKIKLDEICKIYDGTHQTPQYTNTGVKFVSVENIDALYNTEKYISAEDFEKYKAKPQIGDILMTRITAGIIGKCTVIDRDEPLAYYVSLALLRPNHDVLNSRYLKYFVISSPNLM